MSQQPSSPNRSQCLTDFTVNVPQNLALIANFQSNWTNGTNYFLGGKVNQQRWTDRWTALHLAAMMGDRQTVEILLREGPFNSPLELNGLVNVH